MHRILRLFTSFFIIFVCGFILTKSAGNIVYAWTETDTPVLRTGILHSKFLEATAIAVDSEGNVYVADSSKYMITKYDSEYRYVNSWGSYGTGEGEFDDIEGPSMGIDSEDNLYVADSGNNRVQKFNSAGEFLLEWGQEAIDSDNPQPGEMENPTGVFVDENDNVFVVDQYYNRVQKFDSDGTFILQIGDITGGLDEFDPSENGELNYPTAIAVDNDGNIFVSDYDNERIQKFNSSGEYITKWTIFAEDIQIIGNYLYAIDGTETKISKYSLSGDFVSSWGTAGDGQGELDGPGSIDIDLEGNMYVLDENVGSLMKFTMAGVYIDGLYNSSGSGDGQFDGPSDVTIDGNGNIYVVDNSYDNVQKFNSGGQYVLKWGGSGTENGQFDYPSGIAVDSNGNVYVADSGNARIQKFSSEGEYLSQFGSAGTGDGEFTWPTDIYIDNLDNIYVNDIGTLFNRIVKFDSDGVFVSNFGSYGTDDGEWEDSNGFDVDEEGNIYIADSGSSADQVQVLDSTGTFVMKFGSNGAGNGEFDYPTDIIIDEDGYIYVLDTGNKRVQKFDSEGNYLMQWSINFPELGSTSYAIAMEEDSNGDIYIVDASNMYMYVITYSFDKTPPVITSTQSDGDTITATSISIGGTVTDTLTDITDVEFQVNSTSGTWTNCSPSDGSWSYKIESYSCNVTGLQTGSNTVYIRSTDDKTNTNSAQTYLALNLTVSGNTSGSVITATANTNSHSAHVCHDPKPASAPDLFQINISGTNATLYYSPASGNVTGYYIAYTEKSGTLQHGIATHQKNSPGVLSYHIGYLKPNTYYYFSVRAQGGCNTGDWSPEMKVKTGYPNQSSPPNIFYKNSLWNRISTISSAVLGQTTIKPPTTTPSTVPPTTVPAKPEPSPTISPAPPTSPPKTCFLWLCW